MALVTRGIAQVLEGGEETARKIASSLPDDVGTVTGFHATARAFDEFADPALIDELAKTYGGHADAYVGTYFLEKKESAQFFFEGKGWPDLIRERQKAAEGLEEGRTWLSENAADLAKAEAIPNLLRRYAPATRDSLSAEEQRLASIAWGASLYRNQVKTGERVAAQMVGKDPRIVEATVSSLNPKVFPNRAYFLEDMEEFSGVERLDGGAVDEDMAEIGLAYRRHLQDQGFDSVKLESYAYGGPDSPAVIPFETSQIQIKGTREAVQAASTSAGGGKVVGFAGYSRTGKDAAADVLVKEHGYERLGLSAPLMKEALERNPMIGDRSLSSIVEKMGWEAAKDEVPEVRPILVGIGNEWRAQRGGEALVKAALEQRDPAKNYVVTGVRFQGEVDTINEIGGAVLRVNRPGVGPANESETQIADLTGAKDLANDRSLRVTHRRVERQVIGRRQMSSARRAHLDRVSRPGFIDDPARLDPANFG